MFVVARPATDAASHDILLYAITLPRWGHSVPAVISALEGEILGSAPHRGALSLMIAAPGHIEPTRFAKDLANAGVDNAVVEPIGSHAARYELNEARSGVFAPGGESR